MRQARVLGLILVKERRRRGMSSLTNVVTIASPEWSNWLKRGGFRKLSPTDTSCNNLGLDQGLDLVFRARADTGE